MVDGEITTQESILWDRKRDGGFPGMFCMFPFSFLCFALLFCFIYWGWIFMHLIYMMHGRCLVMLFNAWSNHFFLHSEVKALKSLVRNVIAPNRDLGHTDRALKKEQGEKEAKKEEKKEERKDKAACEDCQ